MMNFLDIIWLLSTALAAITPLIMLSLVVKRVFHDRIQARRRQRADDLVFQVLVHLDEDVLDEAYIKSLRGRDKKLLGSLIGDLSRLVRGDNRNRLIELMRRLDVVARQINVLRGGSKQKRIAACANLAYFEDDKVARALTAALDDEDYDVRMSAARALADINRAPPIDVLVDKLDINSGFRSKALSNLFRDLGQPAVAELMHVASRAHLPEQLRILAISALGRIGDLAAVEALVQLAHDPSLEVRATVFRALAMLSHPSASEVLAEGLRDPAWEVRTQAAVCAGRIGAVGVIPMLMRLLNDDVWWARYRAGEALFTIGEAGIEMLLAAAREHTPAGESAALILAEKMPETYVLG